MDRRGAIGLGAGLGLGGLLPARPDQQYFPARAGVAPGPRTNIRAQLVTIIGGGAHSGLFVYSGTPANGNPPVFSVVAPGVTSDPYGNPVAAVMEAGAVGTNYTQIDSAGRVHVFGSGQEAITLDPAREAMFVYQGGAALGSLVASIGALDDNDAFGQPVLDGIVSYLISLTGLAIRIGGGIIDFRSSAGPGQPWVAGGNISGDGAGDIIISALGGQSIFLDSKTAISDSTTSASLLVVTAGALGSGMAQFLVSGDSNPRFVWDTTAAGAARFRMGPGNATPDINIARGAAGGLNITNGAAPNLVSLVTADLDISTVGRGLQIAEGANARMGLATLVGGTQTIANTTITANTRIFLSRQNLNGTPGHLSVNRTVGVNFTINSSTNLDTSQVAWLLVEPG